MAYEFSRAEVLRARTEYLNGDFDCLEGIWQTVRDYGFPFKSAWMDDAIIMFKNCVDFGRGVSGVGLVDDNPVPFKVISSSAINTTCFMRIGYKKEHYYINNITDHFTEYARMNCIKTECESNKTPLRQFPIAVPFLIDHIVDKGATRITPVEMREAVYTFPGIPCIHPAFALASGHGVTKVISLFTHLGVRRVLDPCAGYGDRCVAALASNIDEYVGVDPNPELVAGHTRLIETLSPHSACTATIINAPFEDDAAVNVSALTSKGYFDCVYTSPPFGTTHDGAVALEHYAVDGDWDRSAMSAVKYPGEAWLTDWFIPMLKKAWLCLCSGGWFIIHITDHRTNNGIVGAMQRCIRRMGGEICGVIGVEGSQGGPPYPAWAFKK